MNVFRPKTYVKYEPNDEFYRQVNAEFFFSSRLKPAILGFFTFVVISTQFVVPFFTFKKSASISRPVAYSALGVASGFRDFTFNELDNEENQVLGATSVSEHLQKDEPVPDYFTITIPKLGIKNAIVKTNSQDLDPDDALGHYPGTELPGEVGNTFVFGHSVLPMFYNPENYKSIFSTLDTLEVGDTFTVNYNNKVYRYAVESTRELKPKNVNPLGEFKPRYLNESTMVLMTCTPPGAKTNRLLVEAVLQK